MENKDQSDEVASTSSVQFAKAVPKFICSKHSGCVLAQSEPSVPLTSSNALRASEVFLAALTLLTTSEAGNLRTECNTIPNVMIYELLISYGLVMKRIDIEAVNQVIGKFYRGPADMNESNFLDFLVTFEALPYYYGQRLRRNAGRGEAEAFRELVIRGCNPNAADGEGLNSLHYACEFNRHNVIREMHSLIGEQLILNAKDKYGWSPLHCAVHHGSEECARLLVKLGADISLSCCVGKSPLHMACTMNRTALCEFLLIAGADPNLQDDNGMTPVHDAAFKGHTKLYQALIKLSPNSGTDTGICSVDLNIRDKLGYLSSDYLSNFQYEFPPDPPGMK